VEGINLPSKILFETKILFFQVKGFACVPSKILFFLRFYKGFPNLLSWLRYAQQLLRIAQPWFSFGKQLSPF
jgi:hypothetical protein